MLEQNWKKEIQEKQPNQITLLQLENEFCQ